MTSKEINLRSIYHNDEIIGYRLEVVGYGGERRLFLADHVELFEAGIEPIRGNGSLTQEEVDGIYESEADARGGIYINSYDLRDAL